MASKKFNSDKNRANLSKSQYFYKIRPNCMKQYFNWRTSLILIAVIIVAASLYYTSQLAQRLSQEEKKKIEEVVAGIKTLSSAQNDQELTFVQSFIAENTTIPMIIVDEQEQIIDYRNLDTVGEKDVPRFIKQQLAEFKHNDQPIEANFGAGKNYVYFGESNLLNELRFFPYVQLTIIILFLAVVLIALGAAHRSIQNQVWVGLSKETAHQLGTPLSALEGWLELLGEQGCTPETVAEIRKDLDRLKLVADRFGKVGSVPILAEENIVVRLQNMITYMQRRSPHKVTISLHADEPDIPVEISGPLFDWVVENLLRNALDALDGAGQIAIRVSNTPMEVFIDISDTGKGIPHHLIGKVFKPGFTTKKRGWGLGLSLARRIIAQYHRGSVFIKHSEPGKGTTFRIILRR
jgi:signal transduction histidine kinase